MLAVLLSGVGLGLTAGVSPGPLLVLVVTSSLRGGWRDGLITSAAPLATDILVVTIALVTLGRMPLTWVHWLAVVGGIAVIVVGALTMRDARTADLDPAATVAAARPQQLFRDAALVNLVSPHPWIAWFTVLGPLTVAAWRASPPQGVAFVITFYAGLVGAKALLGVLVAGGRHRLSTTTYRRVLLGCGLFLIGLGVLMIAQFAPWRV